MARNKRTNCTVTAAAAVDSAAVDSATAAAGQQLLDVLATQQQTPPPPSQLSKRVPKRTAKVISSQQQPQPLQSISSKQPPLQSSSSKQPKKRTAPPSKAKASNKRQRKENEKVKPARKAQPAEVIEVEDTEVAEVAAVAEVVEGPRESSVEILLPASQQSMSYLMQHDLGGDLLPWSLKWRIRTSPKGEDVAVDEVSSLRASPDTYLEHTLQAVLTAVAAAKSLSVITSFKVIAECHRPRKKKAPDPLEYVRSTAVDFHLLAVRMEGWRLQYCDGKVKVRLLVIYEPAPRLASIRPRSTVTTRAIEAHQEQGAVVGAIGRRVSDLVARWHCPGNCDAGNAQGHCWIDRSTQRHYKLCARDWSEWAHEIEADPPVASLQDPSRRLKDELKAKEEAGGAGWSKNRYQHSSPIQNFTINVPNAHRRSPITPPVVPTEPVSSPWRLPAQDEALKAYFDWHKAKVGNDWKERFEEAWKILDDDCISIVQLRCMTAAELISMKVRSGVAFVLVKDLKAWKHEFQFN
ncbi:MAG: hypothetical protein ACRYGR_09455 [Janthinobacterium lividum]